MKITYLTDDIYINLKIYRSFFKRTILAFLFICALSQVLSAPRPASEFISRREVRDNREQTVIHQNMPEQTSRAARLIDINSAEIDILITLPGIGPRRARNIIEYRDKFRFRRKEDLLSVHGIGPKIFRKLEPLITVN